MEVLAVLPMRGGSKSIPKKSIYPVLGKPLAYYTIHEIKKCKLINRFVAYTDDSEIAEVAKKYGFEVPIERPAEVSGDRATDIETFQELLRSLEKKEGYKPDIVVHLRATVPFRKAEHVDSAIQILIDNPEADSVRGLCEPDLTPFKMYWYKEEGDKYVDYFLRERFPEIFAKFPEPSATARQNFPKIWRHSPQIDVTRYANIMEKNSMSGKNIVPVFVDKGLDVDIDDPEDVAYVEFLIKKLGRDKD